MLRIINHSKAISILLLEHKWMVFPECILMIGKVNHSYALSTSPLQPWVVINNYKFINPGHGKGTPR